MRADFFSLGVHPICGALRSGGALRLPGQCAAAQRIPDERTDEETCERENHNRFQSCRYSEVVRDHTKQGHADSSGSDGKTGHEP
jgi:hypothetical protein